MINQKKAVCSVSKESTIYLRIRIDYLILC